ncbi:glycosyltransferase family A protein [Pedobacter gandavensis]|uniref:glycosyltransferase family 2 protein n=1 Tax=Pedobacter gandavensis TaxID=2679963 RepID=UPI00292D8141|nr:glycosyltransferase family A protein [Pedobacter gandavensis]
MSTPYVSCIMPTANRAKFIPLAIDNFLNQDYRNAELIIIDDGKESVWDIIPKHRRIRYFYKETVSTIGMKRNFACEEAKGEIIMHWDDDDWYAGDWISRQLTAIESSGADICGLNDILFFSPVVGKFWKVVDKQTEHPWLAGATMVYKKKFWQQHPFKDIQIGEDYDYIWNTGATIFAHDYVDGFVATLHAHNTTLKPFEDSRHKKHAIRSMNVKYEGKAENPGESKPYH